MGLRTAKLIDKKIFTEDVVELTFETAENFDFAAGQFVTIKIDNLIAPCFRAYSICTPPLSNGKTFATCLKIVENGRGSNWLNSLKIGSEVSIIGPNGKFHIADRNRNAFFIATGTGITPFLSMIRDSLNKGNEQKLHLLFGLRHIKGIFYKDLLDQIQNAHKNFSYHITLSQPEDASWQNKGRVSDVLRASQLDTKNTDYYLCGLKAMIDEATQILHEKGVPPESIHSEKYD